MEEAIILSELLEDNIENVLESVFHCLASEITNQSVTTSASSVADREERPRNEGYYEVTIERYNNDLFKEHFRMSRRTFEDFVLLLRQEITGKPDYLADLHKKVMFTIWILAKPESFLAAGDRFGFAKSTAYEIFREMLSVIAGMISSFVKFPNRRQCNQEALIFQRLSRGFPGVVGAIYGCHIPIKAPANNAIDFYNRNKIHSIILQGTCDHKGRFIDVFIGMPGRMHDARVFRHSDLFRKLNHSAPSLLPTNLHLLGDSAYSLLQNLMTPFRDNGQLTRRQVNFNQKLSCCRSIIERTFALLKGKFRRLKYLDIKTASLGNKIVAACCVIHNFLINKNETDLSTYELEEHEESSDGIIEVVADDTPAISKRNTISGVLY